MKFYQKYFKMPEPLNNFNKLTEASNPIKEHLNHYIRHYLCLIEYMCYCIEHKRNLPYSKEDFAARTKNDVRQIRSVYEHVENNKIRMIEDFCQFILTASVDFDNTFLNKQYSKEIYIKFNEIKKIIEKL